MQKWNSASVLAGAKCQQYKASHEIHLIFLLFFFFCENKRLITVMASMDQTSVKSATSSVGSMLVSALSLYLLSRAALPCRPDISYSRHKLIKEQLMPGCMCLFQYLCTSTVRSSTAVPSTLTYFVQAAMFAHQLP